MVQDDRTGTTPAGAIARVVRAVLAIALIAGSPLLASGARADEAPAPAAPAAPATGAPGAAAPAAAQAAPASDDPVVAQRGDVKLTAGAVRDLIRNADPEQRRFLESNPSALLQAVRDRLLKMVLVQQAEAVGWDKRPDVAFRVALARDEAIASTWIGSQVPDDPNFPSDAQLQAAYDANKSKLMLPRQYHVEQIFIPELPGASKQTEDADQHKLVDLKQQLTKQHADFATLARRYSLEKGVADNGGDLGWVREDTLAPPIRAVLQGLAEGTVADPVRSQNGWHLIKLLATKPVSQASLAESRDALVRAMRQERVVEAQRAYLGGLIKQQPIEVNEAELSKLATK
jgi:peptidylprolyl isomerase